MLSVCDRQSAETVIQAGPRQDLQDAPLHDQPGGEHHRRHPLPGHGRRPHRRLRAQPVHRGGASAGETSYPHDPYDPHDPPPNPDARPPHPLDPLDDRCAGGEL